MGARHTATCHNITILCRGEQLQYRLVLQPVEVGGLAAGTGPDQPLPPALRQVVLAGQQEIPGQVVHSYITFSIRKS